MDRVISYAHVEIRRLKEQMKKPVSTYKTNKIKHTAHETGSSKLNRTYQSCKYKSPFPLNYKPKNKAHSPSHLHLSVGNFNPI
jgi:hypothetical protein